MKQIGRTIAMIAIFGLSIGTMSRGIFIPRVQAATLSNGGSGFESATTISAGTYTVGELVERENHYYSIDVKAGQELTVTGIFKVKTENERYGTLNTIEIYDDEKELLVSVFNDAPAPVIASTLADSSKSIHIYYIRISDDTWGTESGSLTIALNDRYDAGSAIDAGGSIDNAFSVSASTITGYLSQVDTDDYYSISATKGNVSAKITPAKSAMPTVKIFDTNRKELASEQASNGGEIITASAEISTDQVAYIQVNCDINTGCESVASQYSLVISNGTGGAVAPGIVPPNVLLDFETIVPVVPTGGAAQVDTAVRPVLNQTYDNKVKVKEAAKERIVYVVSREAKPHDLEIIKATMEAQGYKTKLINDTTLMMRKGLRDIKFVMSSGSNQIVVTREWIISPIWIGVVAGVIVLLILVIILVAIKKRKPTATPSPRSVTPPNSNPA